MLSIKARAFAPLCNHSLAELVPPTSFYRQLDAKLDLSFVRGWVQDAYAPTGRPSIDPVDFFKLQLILFFEGLRSERQLIQVVADRLSLRWYVGYDWDEPLPDHSSLTRIRARLGLAIFQRFFARVVELCQNAGLVWGKELIFDGTKVRANADIDSLSPRFYQQAKQHVENLFTADAADAPAPGAGAAIPVVAEPLPADGRPVDGAPASQPVSLPSVGSAAGEELARENQAAWKLLEQCRLDPNRPPSGPYRRITDFRISTTDPDAAPMQTGNDTKLGYSDHYVADGGKARIILVTISKR